MSNIIKMLALAGLVCCLPHNAFADQVDCGSSCPDGQRLVSFSDGNNASCSCVDNSAMDENVSQNRDVDSDAAANQAELDAQNNG